MREFLDDVEALRAKSRQEIDSVNLGGASESTRAICVLNQVLALNMVCVLRHMRHFVTADRFDARTVAHEFLEHTVRESEHSDLIVGRIRQLGGEPTFERTSRSRSQFACDSLGEFEDFIRHDVPAEEMVVALYSEMISWLGDADVASRQLLHRIRSLEEEHAAVMLNFVALAVD